MTVPDDPRPRLLPGRPLPPYTFVPGRTPHPVSDPAGHMHGHAPEPAERLDPDRWQDNVAYLFGIDLFNAGFYWEAHESWERLWHLAGRRGPVADFVKGLIQLAVAGVKVLEGLPDGVVAHARRAAELFGTTAPGRTHFAGMSLQRLMEAAMAAQKTTSHARPAGPVFGFVLWPEVVC
jgi:predicted metal-dependent hydrolase